MSKKPSKKKASKKPVKEKPVREKKAGENKGSEKSSNAKPGSPAKPPAEASPPMVIVPGDPSTHSAAWEDVEREIITHLLGPKEPPAGKTIDAVAEAQRQATVKHEIERLAKVHGIDLAGEFHRDALETPSVTARAKEIKDLSSPMMQAAATDVKIDYERAKIKITRADGSIQEVIKVRMSASVNVRESLKAMGTFTVRGLKVVLSPLKMAMGLTIKIGKWLNVQAAGKSE